jgi:hypothetical protein
MSEVIAEDASGGEEDRLLGMGGAGGGNEKEGDEGAVGGEAVMLGSLQRTVNRFSRRLLRFNTTSAKASMSFMSGAAYLQQKLATAEGTDEVRRVGWYSTFFFSCFFSCFILPQRFSCPPPPARRTPRPAAPRRIP